MSLFIPQIGEQSAAFMTDYEVLSHLQDGIYNTRNCFAVSADSDADSAPFVQNEFFSQRWETSTPVKSSKRKRFQAVFLSRRNSSPSLLNLRRAARDTLIAQMKDETHIRPHTTNLNERSLAWRYGDIIPELAYNVDVADNASNVVEYSISGNERSINVASLHNTQVVCEGEEGSTEDLIPSYYGEKNLPRKGEEEDFQAWSVNTSSQMIDKSSPVEDADDDSHDNEGFRKKTYENSSTIGTYKAVSSIPWKRLASYYDKEEGAAFLSSTIKSVTDYHDNFTITNVPTKGRRQDSSLEMSSSLLTSDNGSPKRHLRKKLSTIRDSMKENLKAKLDETENVLPQDDLIYNAPVPSNEQYSLMKCFLKHSFNVDKTCSSAFDADNENEEETTMIGYYEYPLDSLLLTKSFRAKMRGMHFLAHATGHSSFFDWGEDKNPYTNPDYTPRRLVREEEEQAEADLMAMFDEYALWEMKKAAESAQLLFQDVITKQEAYIDCEEKVKAKSETNSSGNNEELRDCHDVQGRTEIRSEQNLHRYSPNLSEAKSRINPYRNRKQKLNRESFQKGKFESEEEQMSVETLVSLLKKTSIMSGEMKTAGLSFPDYLDRSVIQKGFPKKKYESIIQDFNDKGLRNISNTTERSFISLNNDEKTQQGNGYSEQTRDTSNKHIKRRWSFQGY